jgi:CheY-like chemotaxis protein
MTPKLSCILLIDDDKLTNFINERIIVNSGIGCKVLTALNGMEAMSVIRDLQKTNNKIPELIFLDLNMPVMDGFEFLSKLLEETKVLKAHPNIVVLTTSTHPLDIERIQSISNIEFLTKPLTKEKFKILSDKFSLTS